MDFLRKQVDRVTNAFREVRTADQPAPVDASWTTHDANIALYSALTQSSNSTPRRPALPPEIVLQILEHPSRLVLTSVVSQDLLENPRMRVRSYRSPQEVIRSSPLSAYDAKHVRRVIFEMTGKDQGWSSYHDEHGTYNNTWSWYEAAVFRSVFNGNGEEDETSPAEISRVELHRNRHAGQQAETYRIRFEKDHDLVKALRERDVIALDACAMFHGWECQVYGATIEVWSVDDLSSTLKTRCEQEL